MRFTILRMLSTGSLSAFTASVTQPRSGMRPQDGRPFGVDPVQRLRAAAQAQPGAVAPFAAPPSGAAPAGRALPRGSLLDLSV